MDYVYPIGLPVPAGPRPKNVYQDENLAAGIEGSCVPAKHFDATQSEIINVIEKAGLTPDGEDYTQLYQALINMFPNKKASVGAVPDTLVLRDKNARAEIADPIHPLEIANLRTSRAIPRQGFSARWTGSLSLPANAVRAQIPLKPEHILVDDDGGFNEAKGTYVVQVPRLFFVSLFHTLQYSGSGNIYWGGSVYINGAGVEYLSTIATTPPAKQNVGVMFLAQFAAGDVLTFNGLSNPYAATVLETNIHMRAL